MTELGAPLTLKKAMLFSRQASDGVPGGPLTPVKGSLCTHTVAGDPAGPAQLPLQRCTRLPQTRAQLAPRRRRGSRRGRDGEWEDGGKSSRPHSVFPARLTSRAHPAEVPALPPARRPGPPCSWERQGSRSRMPRRCRRLSPRNCSSGARQRHPRCRPRWTSSHTWGQGGRHMLSLHRGLSLVSCEVGSGCPHFTDVDTEACQDHAESEGQSWDSKLQSMSQQMLPWGGEKCSLSIEDPNKLQALWSGAGLATRCTIFPLHDGFESAWQRSDEDTEFEFSSQQARAQRGMGTHPRVQRPCPHRWIRGGSPASGLGPPLEHLSEWSSPHNPTGSGW